MTDDESPPPEDFDYGEQGEDGQYENYPTTPEGDLVQKPRQVYIHVDGCGQNTRVTGDLVESIARDPTYYSKTYCSGCQEHVPVEEVEWMDGSDWVADDDMSDDDPPRHSGGAEWR